MKCFLIFAQSLMIVLLLAASCAQSAVTQTPSSKIAYVNSEAFYDKETGIRELVKVFGKLEAEFQPQANELTALAEQIMALEKEIKSYDRRICYPRGSLEALEKTIAEYESLIEKYKTKEAVARYHYERRAAETVDVVKKQIARFANLYAAEKGYVLILDISKSNGTFTFSNSGESDVTADLIKYYNEIYTKLKMQ